MRQQGLPGAVSSKNTFLTSNTSRDRVTSRHTVAGSRLESYGSDRVNTLVSIYFCFLTFIC